MPWRPSRPFCCGYPAPHISKRSVPSRFLSKQPALVSAPFHRKHFWSLMAVGRRYAAGVFGYLNSVDTGRKIRAGEWRGPFPASGETSQATNAPVYQPGQACLHSRTQGKAWPTQRRPSSPRIHPAQGNRVQPGDFDKYHGCRGILSSLARAFSHPWIDKPSVPSRFILLQGM